jgi:putative Mn2+ efflux pump MntP
VIGINVYFLSTSFVGWLIHSGLPKYANVLMGMIGFPLMAIYVISIIYLTLRKDSDAVPSDKSLVVFQKKSEKGLHGCDHA